MALVVFARIGWMKWYRGPQPDDEAPIGGGKYNKSALGHEAFNFFPLNGKMLGYFQPRLIPGRSSTLALERIKAGFKGDALDNVTVVLRSDGSASSDGISVQRFIEKTSRQMLLRETCSLTLARRMQRMRFLSRSHGAYMRFPEEEGASARRMSAIRWK
jgi:hypothetical protein